MPTPWENIESVSTNWDTRTGYLQQEDSFYLLLEDNGKIVLNGPSTTPWTNRTEI